MPVATDTKLAVSFPSAVTLNVQVSELVQMVPDQLVNIFPADALAEIVRSVPP